MTAIGLDQKREIILMRGDNNNNKVMGLVDARSRVGRVIGDG